MGASSEVLYALKVTSAEFCMRKTQFSLSSRRWTDAPDCVQYRVISEVLHPEKAER